MTLTQLRKEMMFAKKADTNRASVLQAILSAALMIAKNDGNREANENDIVQAAKKESKMAQQSKDAGAPYNEMTFEVCNEFLPKVMDETQTKNAIQAIVSELSMPADSVINMKMMGKVMGALKGKYGESLDGALASKLVKEILLGNG